MDDILLAIKVLISTAVGSGYTILYGDNFAPAETDYPFISIEPIEESYEANGTGGLRLYRFTIEITLKITLKDYLADDTSISVQKHLQELVNVMAEKGTNGLPTSTTIYGALNNDLSLGGTVHIMNLGTIQYNTQTGGAGSYIRTAALTITGQQQLPLCT